ncbi:Ferredoxin [Halanaerobium saccharolyticum subsp. saccharolyticum DSM 6643]|uniref:Ferredoxin n=1 Tax=Halanaerobium saccharolyticum subsp. saccharolyticum DSM 6643 TaxID=1293054 RepID=M5DZ68_9FIRM|nr:ferredoxin [Halanaerobium saccharolyticum]CCU78576.1 Ferredoxin [Halanaerobium saccharolyticum subsp. saccharolyticum DSM 6643]
MADVENRVSENVAGDYYVDDQCIACGICVGEAPDNFEMGADYAYVYKQPENEAEKTACESALEACPVDAIGSDG